MGLERHAGKVNNDKNVILGWSNPLKPHSVIKLSISSEPLKLPNEGIQYVALMKGGGGGGGGGGETDLIPKIKMIKKLILFF